MKQKEFEILERNAFSESEESEAKEYWSSIPVGNYWKKKPWSQFIAKRVVDYSPSRVFEFGCSAGKNLRAILEISREIEVFGVDINDQAIAYAQESGLNVAIADEDILELFPVDSFDVVFSISVLDHLPYPAPVLANLARIARRAVLLLEPWLGEEGKVVRNFNVQQNSMVDTTPYSYSWNYVTLGEQVLPDWNLIETPYPMNSNLGRFYSLYSFESSE
jgi:SAM-dependent methyltransferase